MTEIDLGITPEGGGDLAEPGHVQKDQDEEEVIGCH